MTHHTGAGIGQVVGLARSNPHRPDIPNRNSLVAGERAIIKAWRSSDPKEKAQKEDPMEKVSFVDNEGAFRWSLLQDQMAFDKLHEGIRKFAVDADELKSLLEKKL